MAKDAHDREDLLRDASAMDVRVELRIAGVDHSVYCGFRTCGVFSLYWNQDNVVQFNAHGELRRAFWRNRMLASYERQLHWLNRDLNSARMRLSREPLTDDELAALEEFVSQSMVQLRDSFSTNSYEVVGKFPEDLDVCKKVAAWLEGHPDSVRYALHPGVGRAH
jgi:hypothetical protein